MKKYFFITMLSAGMLASCGSENDKNGTDTNQIDTANGGVGTGNDTTMNGGAGTDTLFNSSPAKDTGDNEANH
ncbi:hypothetical protein LT679_16360 [Mucilaginibacter roseus]|uniref:Entericidin n=1 Tax=Mucilaginibacter roseus TaxID=1528868 RepID=A0ABS8U8R8_9SPHI|nr:hypothetical protein [Mucilaginibacter roseus]MCD8742186.1 hypothetical protein [Mucilaginibacter roseus]